MDVGHFVLGALVLVLATAVLKRRHRELHIRIDWKENHDEPDPDRRR